MDSFLAELTRQPLKVGEFVDYCNSHLPPTLPRIAVSDLKRWNFVRESYSPGDIHKVIERLEKPEEEKAPENFVASQGLVDYLMERDLNNDAIAHKFAQERGYYPISRQGLSAEYVDIVSKPHCRGRPRNGEWKECVICNRPFYVRPSRKNHAYTCSRSCANRILGKFRWLKYNDRFDNMFWPEVQDYVAELIPFAREQNAEAWDYYFEKAYSLTIVGTLTRCEEFEEVELGVWHMRKEG